jgi:hypothetical protein
VSDQHFQFAGPFRKRAGDPFMIPDEAASRGALQQGGEQVRLLKSGRKTLAERRRAAGKQREGMLEQFRVRGVGRQQCFHVAGLVGVQLALGDGPGGMHRADGGRKFVGPAQAARSFTSSPWMSVRRKSRPSKR